ncbi:MAG: SDR family NAD(P)-dependent oxidoreductase, partial [Deltaproteobacteria bacterium]|nr:SDR family NAD(P)-dependent oxidoreductase [Deltaproteobacteria bacterium]
MADELRFDGRVAIVTGAGNGLGRSHALLLARRGAKVVINDLGGSHTGGGKSSAAADAVVEEIRAGGGEAVANYDSVEDGAAIVKSAIDAFGRVDIVVNNAGILRDVSFQKMTADDWDLVYRVHVLGAYRVTAAAWPHLREQKYGRVVFTSSAAGIYGNFGQANYSMAKLGLVGFASTLALEGKKNNVVVNTIAPIAGSRMTETVLPKDLLDSLKPEFVSPLVAWLCHEGNTDTGGLFEVGGGFMGKLRWERTAGTTFRLGRGFGPEQVKARWGEITDFAKSERPASVTESMAPIMANVEAGPSKGGNDFIDVDAALGYQFPEYTSRYDERDLALYALGVGASREPLDRTDLHYTYELDEGFQALPTYAVVPVVNGILDMGRRGETAPGLNFGLDRILHGEQYTELLRPLPAKQKLTHRARVKAIYDKGKGAVVVNETKSYDEDGELLAINEVTTFVRGAGGWGGDRGPSADVNVPPDRAPDAVLEDKTSDSQALLYRLSGDWNPLHADPGFAGAFGYAKPILHGLCSFGYAGRHVLKAFTDGDASRFKSIKARFADTVFPGETLVTEMWKESETRVVFRCKVKERDKVVISNAAVELYTEVPQKKSKAVSAAPAKAEAAAPAATGKITSGLVFEAIGAYLTKNPDVASKVGTVFQFKLNEPASQWTLDLKLNKVAKGETAVPECTLELSDADFMAMTEGKANPMKLFTTGKLKISGNVMASQKLDFLTKIDRKAMEAAAAGVVASAAPAAA